MTWLIFGVSMAAGEGFRDYEYPQREQMLQRAEAYLNAACKTDSQQVAPYAMIVRGLLSAGFSPNHPFLRTKTDILLRLVPRDRHEAASQREIMLLVRLLRMPLLSTETSSDRLARLFPLEQDASTLQAAIVSNQCNDNYQRFGVIQRPRGFTPERPFDHPLPENGVGKLMVATHVLPNSSRSFDVDEISESITDVISSCLVAPSPSREIDRRIGYVLIAQTICLRN